MSPSTPTVHDDFYADELTLYATVHSQIQQGNRWIDRYFTLSLTVSTHDTVGSVQQQFADLATPILDASGAVLVSIEVVAPAFFAYFQGF